MSSTPFIEAPSLRARVATNISWLGLAQALRSSTGLIVTAVLARLLTPADFGVVALVMIASGFVSMFSETGLTSALIQRTDVTDKHLSSVFWVNLAVASALAVTGVVAAPLFSALFAEPRTTRILAVLMIALPVAALGQVPESILQRRLAFRSIAIIEWLATVISGVSAVVLAMAGYGVWALVVQALVVALVGSTGRLLAARWRPVFSVDLQSLRHLASFSFSVFGGNLLNYGFRKIDNFLIGRYLGATALGYYALAYNLVLFPLVTCGAVILRVMFPVLSSLQGDYARLRLAYLRTLRLLGTLTLPMVIGLGATAPLLIATAYGAKWAPAAPILRLLTVVGAFEAISTAGILLYAVGRPGVLVRWAIVSIVTMTGAFSVGLRWGPQGVAAMYAIVSPVLFVMPHVFAARSIDLSVRRVIAAAAPPLASALVMGAAVIGIMGAVRHAIPTLWIAFTVTVAIGAIVYSVTLLAIGTVAAGGRGALPWILGQHFAEGGIEYAASITAGPVQNEADIFAKAEK